MIHPTAIIDPKAELDTNIEIGPYTIIKENTFIGSETTIGSHVVIEPFVHIRPECQIFQYAAIGDARRLLRPAQVPHPGIRFHGLPPDRTPCGEPRPA